MCIHGTVAFTRYHIIVNSGNGKFLNSLNSRSFTGAPLLGVQGRHLPAQFFRNLRNKTGPVLLGEKSPKN